MSTTRVCLSWIDERLRRPDNAPPNTTMRLARLIGMLTLWS